MSHRISIKPRFIALALGSALAACSNDVVDLGGGNVSQSIEAGSTCATSAIVEGDVHVENQAELDALLGCEEIRGGLRIEIFENTDLTPLAELRAVEGDLFIGSFPDPSSPELTLDVIDALYLEYDRVNAIAAANWLPSLAGVESLERVGGLVLHHISAPSLEAFESLRLVSGSTNSAVPGQLAIFAAPNLVDLAGLENARGFRALEIRENPALESLNGLQVLTTLVDLYLENNRALTNIDALAPITTISGLLYIYGTALPNLDAFANLTGSFMGVAISENPELSSVAGLARLTSAQSLLFERNAKLERLPEFAEMAYIDAFRVRLNAALESLSLSFPAMSASATFFGATYSAETIEIIGNDQLTSLAFGAGLGDADSVSISHNAGLTNIDLGDLQRIDDLQITGNGALTGVALDVLQTVDSLSVTRNPLLSTAELRTVRTFESEFIGNADDPSPAP
jgi:hypothetical protein